MKYRTVVPIPPSYTKEGALDLKPIKEYTGFLYSRGISDVMTTAGTSQFDLLSLDEVHKLNKEVCTRFKKNVILGVPPLPLKGTTDFIKQSLYEYAGDKTSFMVLYPERHYDDDTIINFFSKVHEQTGCLLYIHAMWMRSGLGGFWDYTSKVINTLYDKGVIKGIKEEHFDLGKAFNFVRGLDKNMDVIVAGGSMRRHQYLRHAGANAFLSGIGSIFPKVETDYAQLLEHPSFNVVDKYLNLESKLFDVFMKHGWHRSLRYALSWEGLGCDHDREPWSPRNGEFKGDIIACLEEIKNEM